MRGADTTITVIEKLQKSVRVCASAAMHDTGVDPAGRLDPLVGKHVVVTGIAPPTTVGGGYVTMAGAAATCSVAEAGHEILGGSMDGRAGEPHPAATATATATKHDRPILLDVTWRHRRIQPKPFRHSQLARPFAVETVYQRANLTTNEHARGQQL
jgi:hypothetical protein